VAHTGALFASRLGRADLPTLPTYVLKPAHPTAGRPFTSASPLMVKRRYTGTGILNLFAIAYAFRPRLRTRLTLSRLTLLRNPWVCGDTVFRSVYRYLCQHFLFCKLQHASRRVFDPRIANSWLAYRMLSYRPVKDKAHSFGGTFSPENYRRRIA
jgi:hypothetical protein